MPVGRRSGSCAPALEIRCGDYACTDSGCRTTCRTDADCSENHVCRSAHCTSGASCLDATHSQAPNGDIQDCGANRCRTDGACGTSCTSSAECAPSYVCDGEQHQCIAANADTGSGQSDGCGCRLAGESVSPHSAWVGLCGALVHEPDLLILDEPTTGVDPLSRRQFWTLIDDIRKGRASMSVVIATAYMDEAQQWDWIIAMDAGKVLATGTPAELMQRTGTKDLEHCFIALLPEEKRRGHKELIIPPRARTEIAIEAIRLNPPDRRPGQRGQVDGRAFEHHVTPVG